MKQLGLWVACLLLLPTLGGAQDKHATSVSYDVFELYTWKADDGQWSFSLFNAATSINKTAKQVLDPKVALKGLDAVNLEIAKLPRGSELLLNMPVEMEGRMVRFNDPPSDLLAKIKASAETRGIRIIVER